MDAAPIERTQCQECLECARPWLETEERWRAYIDGEGDLLLYCPACASREFDS